jgi:hypothetical protein
MRRENREGISPRSARKYMERIDLGSRVEQLEGIARSDSELLAVIDL